MPAYTPTARMVGGALATNFSTAAVASLTLTYNVATMPGQFLLAVVAWEHATATMTTPSGWTIMGDDARSNCHQSMYWKIANGTETTVVFDLSGADTSTMSGFSWAISGTDEAGPHGFTQSGDSTTTNTTTSPALTGVPSRGVGISISTSHYVGTTTQNSTVAGTGWAEAFEVSSTTTANTHANALALTSYSSGSLAQAVHTWNVSGTRHNVCSFVLYPNSTSMARNGTYTKFENAATSNTTVTFNCVAGELLIGCTFGNTQNVTTPTGWKLLGSQLQTSAEAYWYYKLADGTETSVLFARAGASPSASCVLRYNGASPNCIAFSPTGDNTADADIVGAALTGVPSRAIPIAFGMERSTAGISTCTVSGTGWTEIVDVANDLSSGANYAMCVAQSSLTDEPGAPTFTFTQTGTTHCAAVLYIVPGPHALGVGTGAGNAGASTTLTINKPATAIAKTVLIAAINVANAAGTCSRSGWTEISSIAFTASKLFTFYYIVPDDELSTSFAFTTSNHASAGVIVAFDGCRETNPVMTASVVANAASTNAFGNPLTYRNAGWCHVWCCGSDTATAQTINSPPNAFKQIQQRDGSGGASERCVSIGSMGTRTPSVTSGVDDDGTLSTSDANAVANCMLAPPGTEYHARSQNSHNIGTSLTVTPVAALYGMLCEGDLMVITSTTNVGPVASITGGHNGTWTRYGGIATADAGTLIEVWYKYAEANDLAGGAYTVTFTGSNGQRHLSWSSWRGDTGLALIELETLAEDSAGDAIISSSAIDKEGGEVLMYGVAGCHGFGGTPTSTVTGTLWTEEGETVFTGGTYADYVANIIGTSATNGGVTWTWSQNSTSRAMAVFKIGEPLSSGTLISLLLASL